MSRKEWESDIQVIKLDIIETRREALAEKYYPGGTAKIIGTRAGRKYHFEQMDGYLRRTEQISTMVFNKQAKVALSELKVDWRKYLYDVLARYAADNTHLYLPKDSALYKELTEEPVSEAAQQSISSLVASTSSLSLSAPTLEQEQDWRSVMTAETVLQEPLPMGCAGAPDVAVVVSEDTFSNERGEEFSAVHSREVEKLLGSALFKLVNVEDPAQVVAIEDPAQFVAIEGDKWKPEVSGGYGQLYRGKYFIRDGAPFEHIQYVVAKKNKLSSLVVSVDRMRDERKKLRRRMKEEAEIAKRLDHPTIAHYFGLFIKEDELTNDLADFFLVSDYVNGGPAKAFLDAHRTPYVAEKLFRDLMDGLTYIHSEQRIGTFDKKMICHGDLKGNNYLVELGHDDRDPSKLQITGKIIDFGLSHILNAISGMDSANSQVSDAVRWQAPEMANVKRDDVTTRAQYMEKADVWSFALTSLEVAQNLDDPFPSVESGKEFFRLWALMPEKLLDLLPRSNADTLLSQAAFDIMTLCWKIDPEQRPHMHEAQARYLFSHPGAQEARHQSLGIGPSH